MAITEKSRHELYRRLEEILGPDEANTLMEHLPPVGWADVATKEDLHQLETRLDARFEVFEFKLRSEMANLGSDLRTEMAKLGSDLRTEMADLAIEVHSTLRTNAYLTVGAIAAAAGFLGAITSLS
jgi:hypothetical protein